MKRFILCIGLILCLQLQIAAAQEKIRVGQGSISLQSGLMHIAKDRGLFAKYGLVAETIYIPGGSTNVQVLISGSLDLSQLSGAPLSDRLLKLQDSQPHFGDEFLGGDDVRREGLDLRSQSFELRVDSRELLDLHKLTFLREPVLS